MRVTAADSEKMNLSGRNDPKRTSIEGEIAKRKKLGAEELRLSRVDVRERQKRFEKMANGANLQDGVSEKTYQIDLLHESQFRC